jgi:DNA uptake protein ComE-like DNA-binding protein
MKALHALFFLFLTHTAHAADPLIHLEGCTLVQTDWSDGDSFPIRTADGKEITIRLYGADCIEWHVTDESDARRLRAQRRYFGISDYGGGHETSIEIAKGFGGKAAEEVARALAESFSVHTAYSDARGDGRYKRFYGFVTTSKGEDLATRLVGLGLARAFGVYRETPAGITSKEFRASLEDLELKAAKKGLGAWTATDWEHLPEERKEGRDENAEIELAQGDGGLAAGDKINPNTAARDELMKLPGIGEVTTNRIIEARPFSKLEDLDAVDGIGKQTLLRLAPFLVFE